MEVLAGLELPKAVSEHLFPPPPLPSSRGLGRSLAVHRWPSSPGVSMLFPSVCACRWVRISLFYKDTVTADEGAH